MNTPKEFLQYVKQITNVDIYQKTRAREVVEARCLTIFILRNYFNMRFIEITSLFNKQNLKYTNANILNSYKKFIVYKRNNPQLATDYELILKKLNDNTELKRAMLIEEIKYSTPKELDAFQNIYDRKLLTSVNKILN
jgi:hypothetical protein